MTQTATEALTTATWGFTTDGDLHCSTCKGRQEVRCPRTATLTGPFADAQGTYWMCEGCDEAVTATGRGHGKVNCPTCER